MKDKLGAWLYFKGVAQSTPLLYGVGGTIHLLDHHWLKFKVGINNICINLFEMMALKLTHKLGWDCGAWRVEVFGYSQAIIL